MLLAVLVDDNAFHRSGSDEVLVGDKHAREELVFERHPFQVVVGLILVVACLAEVLHVVARKFVEHTTVAFLESLTFLVAHHLLVPFKVHCRHVGRDNGSHVLLHHLHTHEIAVFRKRISDAEVNALSEVEFHQHRRVVFLHRSEVELLGVETVCVGVDGEAVRVVLAVEKHAVAVFSVLESVVFLQRSLRYLTAFRREVERQQLVLKFYGLVSTANKLHEVGVFSHIFGGVAHLLHRRVVEQTVVGRRSVLQIRESHGHIAAHHNRAGKAVGSDGETHIVVCQHHLVAVLLAVLAHDGLDAGKLVGVEAVGNVGCGLFCVSLFSLFGCRLVALVVARVEH